MHIDLNADVGESFGAYGIGHDAGLMRVITSANIAAGFHGGDPTVLRATLRLAKAHGVAVGAHPGFPDRAGFGRREIKMSPNEVEDIVLYQIAVVAGVAQTEGLRLQHVKPHGALYNLAARDFVLANAMARAVAAFDRRLIVFGPPGSALIRAAQEAGLATAAEGFADRAYESDGSLVDRKKEGAVLDDVSEVVARAIDIVRKRRVVAVDGSSIPLAVDTLCVHSDTPRADYLAERLRTGLAEAGVAVSALAGR